MYIRAPTYVCVLWVRVCIREWVFVHEYIMCILVSALSRVCTHTPWLAMTPRRGRRPPNLPHLVVSHNLAHNIILAATTNNPARPADDIIWIMRPKHYGKKVQSDNSESSPRRGERRLEGGGGGWRGGEEGMREREMRKLGEGEVGWWKIGRGRIKIHYLKRSIPSHPYQLKNQIYFLTQVIYHSQKRKE